MYLLVSFVQTVERINNIFSCMNIDNWLKPAALISLTSVVPVSSPIELEVSPPLEADQGEEGVGTGLVLGHFLVARLCLVDLLVDVLGVALLGPDQREPVHGLPPGPPADLLMTPGLLASGPGPPALVDTRPLQPGPLLGRCQGQRSPVWLRQADPEKRK